MLYTLLKFLGWGALLAFIGGCIGWALRALKARGELARVKSSMVDSDEMERMRHRLSDLDQVIAERDRLRIQLADVRHTDSPGIVGAEVPPPAALESDEHSMIGVESVDPSLADGPPVSEESSSRTDPADPAGREPEGPDPEGPEPDRPEPDEVRPDGPGAEGPATPSRPPDVELDLDEASSVLGKKIRLDDLTVVEGIGPKISELCSGIGITTWRQLAETDVAELQSILDAAGSRYTVHKPTTWPHQAELLATGRWVQFRTFSEDLKRDKE